jgi:hypothetical protein
MPATTRHGKPIERPPNYESLTLTNSSAEFGHHSLSPPRAKDSKSKLKHNNTIIEEDEDTSFVQKKMGPCWKGTGLVEPNPMDEDLPEFTISNPSTQD